MKWMCGQRCGSGTSLPAARCGPPAGKGKKQPKASNKPGEQQGEKSDIFKITKMIMDRNYEPVGEVGQVPPHCMPTTSDPIMAGEAQDKNLTRLCGRRACIAHARALWMRWASRLGAWTSVGHLRMEVTKGQEWRQQRVKNGGYKEW